MIGSCPWKPEMAALFWGGRKRDRCTTAKSAPRIWSEHSPEKGVWGRILSSVGWGA